MEYRQFNKTGLFVSEIGIGTNRFGHKVDKKDVVKILHYCVDNNINHIDTANVYANGKSEEILGESFGNLRKDFIIGTKVGWNNSYDNDLGLLSSRSINYHVNNSLTKLKTDYIDILWLHKWDNTTRIDETLTTINSLINLGKIRYIGISNFNSWQTALTLVKAKTIYNIEIIATQSEYNLINRNTYSELHECLKYFNLSLVPFFPLASGFLTGKYKKNVIPKNSRAEWADYMKVMFKSNYFSFLEELSVIAKRYKCSLTEISIAWLLSHSNVTSVINGVRNVKQLKENIKSSGIQINMNDLILIDSMYEKHFK